MTQADADFKTSPPKAARARIVLSSSLSAPPPPTWTLATYRATHGNFYSFTDAIYQQDNYRAWDAYRNEQENLTDNTPRPDTGSDDNGCQCAVLALKYHH